MSMHDDLKYDGLTPGMVPIGKPYDKYNRDNNTAIFDLAEKHGPGWQNVQGESAEDKADRRETVLNDMEKEMEQLGLRYVRSTKKEESGCPIWENEPDKERRIKLRNRLDYWLKTSKPQKGTKAPGSSASTTASVSSQSMESTAESEQLVDLATGMSKLSIDGESMNWSDSPVSQERLDLLVGTIEGNPKAYKYLVQQAGDSQDESATKINGAIQIFLDPISKGQAHAYKGLRRFYQSKDRHLFIEPEEIATLVKHVAVQKSPELQDHTVTNPSFLIGEGERGPQPAHTDTKQPVLGVKPEKFGILLFTEGGAPGTISYDMEGIPASPTIEDLTKLWPDAPKGLLKKIGETPEAVELIRGYGQLLWASADKRMEPGVVPQYWCKILAGSHPHCAPASVDGKKRTVLFFVLQPLDEGAAAANATESDDDGEFYDGETQVSKEKLVFLLYETLLGKYGYVGLKCEETNFLLDKFVEFVSDSAELGARDLTFNLPDNLKLSLDQIWGKATDAQAAKQALAKGEQALAKLRENSESADAQLASTKGHVVAAFHGSDFLDGVADEKKTPE